MDQENPYDHTQNEPEQKPSLMRRGVKILLGLGLSLLVLFFILSLIVQIPTVQNYLATRITNFLSEKIETEVHLDKINLQFFDKLELQGLYVQDYDGDTLLYSGEFNIDFDLGLRAIWNRQFILNHLTVRNTSLNIERDSSGTPSNLATVLSKLSSKKPDDQTGPVEQVVILDHLQSVRFENVRFRNHDEYAGTDIMAYLPEGEIKINSIDQSKRIYHLNSVDINEPAFEFEKFPVQRSGTNAGVARDSVVEGQIVNGLDTVEKRNQFFIGSLDVTKGRFLLKDRTKYQTRRHAANEIDFAFLDISEIDIDVDSFLVQGDSLTAQIDRIHAYEASGFALNDMEASRAIITPEMIELQGLKLTTPNTSMGDYLRFSYASPDAFKNFADEVFIEAIFKDTRLSLSEIMMFVPALKNNAFLQNNADEPLDLSGQVYGRVNRLLAKDLNLRFQRGLQMQGSFRTRNLAVKGQEIINLDLDYLNTRMAVLRQLIPNFNPPENFSKLGKLRFSGKFDGFFTDFVAYGKLRTDLGRAEMDMNLNSRQGLSNAKYSGNLNLYDFDLRTWLDDDRFEKITFTSTVREGVGLQSENVQANLEAYIKNFSFKGYNYANMDFTGQINAERFDGALEINDENLKFDLVGFVALFQEDPQYNFEATLERINLNPLKLSEKDYVLSGKLKVDATGNSLSDFAGTAMVEDIHIQRPGLDQRIDTLFMESIVHDSTEKVFRLRSELMDATLVGNFEIQNIPNTFEYFVKKQYPAYFDMDSIGIKQPEDYAFNFDLQIKKTESLTQLIDPKLQPINNLELSGSFDNRIDKLDFDLNVPKLTYGKVELINTILISEIKGNFSKLTATGFRKNPDKTILSPFKLRATERKDSISFILDYTSTEDGSQTLLANGSILNEDNWITVSLFDTDLTLFGDIWRINERNQIRFRKDQLDIESFVLRSGDRLVRIRDVNKRGLIAHFLNFEAGLIDTIWDYDNLNFDGGLQVQLTAKDIFKREGLKAEVSIDSFHINKDDWGFLYLMAELPDMTSSGTASIEIIKEEQRIFAKGKFDPATKQEDQELTTFNFDVDGTNLPFALLGYFINGVSDITGTLDADLVIDGNSESPQINGNFYLPDAGLTFDYLNTRYYTRQETIPITTDFIDLSGTTLYDELGNTALIMGGLGHNFFADFTVDVLVTSNRFMVLNTTKKENPDYYGKGIGELTAAFSGDFINTEIYVNGSTLRGSRISIPVTEESLPNELSFIHFVNETEETGNGEQNGQNLDNSGLQFDMDLTVTEDAEVLLIFDERAGDIIRGRGRGDLSMSINSRGDFTMYGEYEIAQGEYLFTLYNIVNKPFILRPGGTIKWSGDPYNAQLNINAEYKGLNASVYNLVAEYLTEEQLKSEARQPTPVDLIMMLEGPLLQPIINFDIKLPKIQGELQSYTENKLRILRQDQNELNRQVFGLMVIGGFLPTGQGDTQGKQFISGVNTVSEFITNQLSIYLTELISEVVNDVGFISGVDFDIAYNVYYYDETLPDQSLLQTGGDLQNRMKLYLLDDRLTVNVGGNFNFELNNAYVPIGGTYAGSDIIIEYVVTDDRKLKIRAYQETDRTVEGTRTRWGGGISFRHEFNRLGKEKTGVLDSLPAQPDTTGNSEQVESSTNHQ